MAFSSQLPNQYRYATSSTSSNCISYKRAYEDPQRLLNRRFAFREINFSSAKLLYLLPHCRAEDGASVSDLQMMTNKMKEMYRCLETRYSGGIQPLMQFNPERPCVYRDTNGGLYRALIMADAANSPQVKVFLVDQCETLLVAKNSLGVLDKQFLDDYLVFAVACRIDDRGDVNNVDELHRMQTEKLPHYFEVFFRDWTRKNGEYTVSLLSVMDPALPPGVTNCYRIKPIPDDKPYDPRNPDEISDKVEFHDLRHFPPFDMRSEERLVYSQVIDVPFSRSPAEFYVIVSAEMKKQLRRFTVVCNRDRPPPLFTNSGVPKRPLATGFPIMLQLPSSPGSGGDVTGEWVRTEVMEDGGAQGLLLFLVDSGRRLLVNDENRLFCLPEDERVRKLPAAAIACFIQLHKTGYNVLDDYGRLMWAPVSWNDFLATLLKNVSAVRLMRPLPGSLTDVYPLVVRMSQIKAADIDITEVFIREGIVCAGVSSWNIANFAAASSLLFQKHGSMTTPHFPVKYPVTILRAYDPLNVFMRPAALDPHVPALRDHLERLYGNVFTAQETDAEATEKNRQLSKRYAFVVVWNLEEHSFKRGFVLSDTVTSGTIFVFYYDEGYTEWVPLFEDSQRKVFAMDPSLREMAPLAVRCRLDGVALWAPLFRQTVDRLMRQNNRTRLIAEFRSETSHSSNTYVVELRTAESNVAGVMMETERPWWEQNWRGAANRNRDSSPNRDPFWRQSSQVVPDEVYGLDSGAEFTFIHRQMTPLPEFATQQEEQELAARVWWLRRLEKGAPRLQNNAGTTTVYWMAVKVGDVFRVHRLVDIVSPLQFYVEAVANARDLGTGHNGPWANSPPPSLPSSSRVVGALCAVKFGGKLYRAVIDKVERYSVYVTRLDVSTVSDVADYAFGDLYELPTHMAEHPVPLFPAQLDDPNPIDVSRPFGSFLKDRYEEDNVMEGCLYVRVTAYDENTDRYKVIVRRIRDGMDVNERAMNDKGRVHQEQRSRTGFSMAAQAKHFPRK